jgi:hypothetical protein
VWYGLSNEEYCIVCSLLAVNCEQGVAVRHSVAPFSVESKHTKQVKGIYIKVYYNRSASEKKVGIVDRLVLGLVTQLQGKSCHNSNIQIRFAVIFMSDSIENTVFSNNM